MHSDPQPACLQCALGRAQHPMHVSTLQYKGAFGAVEMRRRAQQALEENHPKS